MLIILHAAEYRIFSYVARHAMAQAVSGQPLIVQAPVQSQASPCGIRR
jgi:hypothetical protein